MSDEDEYMLALSKKNTSLEDEGFSAEQIMEEEYACATELFQQYKYEVNVWYNRNSTHWTFLQTNSYIINKFHHVFRVCAPAAITSILIKLESIYFREPRIFDWTYRLFSEKFTEAVAIGRISQMHFDNGWPIRVGLKRVLDLR